MICYIIGWVDFWLFWIFKLIIRNSCCEDILKTKLQKAFFVFLN